MGNIDWQSHIGEVETIRRPDQRDRNNVVHHELFEVLAWLLHSEDKHDSLLCPVCTLKEVIKLEVSIQSLVWISLKHAGHSEVPNRSMAHNPESQRSSAAEVNSSVHLLHEARLLSTRFEASLDCQWREDNLHDKLAGKRQDDNVERYESEVPSSLGVLVLCAFRRVFRYW